MVAAAMIGGAVIGAVGSNMAAGKQASAANRATDLQQKATNFQEEQQLKSEQNLSPYLQGGLPAEQALQQGTSAGGDFSKPFTMADLLNYKSPGYEFTQQQGELGMNRALAAQGRYGSGAAVKSLSAYDTGLASQTADQAYQNYQNDLTNRFARLSTVANMGQNAAAGLGGLSNQAASTVASSTNAAGQNIIGAGNAGAAGIVGATNSLSSPLQTYGSLGLLRNLQSSNTSAPLSQGTSSTSLNNYAGSDGGGSGVSYGFGSQLA